jgi:hypothetical protein
MKMGDFGKSQKGFLPLWIKGKFFRGAHQLVLLSLVPRIFSDSSVGSHESLYQALGLPCFSLSSTLHHFMIAAVIKLTKKIENFPFCFGKKHQ